MCKEREGRKGGRGERKPVGMAKDFDSQILGIYVMFKLTIWVAGTDDRVIITSSLEPCDSYFKNQNKKVSIGT